MRWSMTWITTNWTTTLAFSVVTALGVLAFDSACMPGTTTVLVTDCSNKPVSGVRVDIKICCAPAAGHYTEFSADTANNGEASFQLNAQQICDGKISFAGFSTTSFGTGSCTKPDKNGVSKCTVKICRE